MNLKKFYSKRKSWSYKGQFGRVLVISGSKRYSGSPIFNAMAALRSGADLVTVVGYERAVNIVAGYSPDIITYPLSAELNLEHVSEIFPLSKDFNSLVVGCGLNRDREAYKAVREIIRKTDLPLVIDAEAIRAVSEQVKILKNKKAVLTPHAEEFRILTREKVKPEINDRKEKVEKWAKKLGVVILLKGHVDIISDGSETALNKTGSPFMTKGGFGDTLSGICGALLARGIKPFEAAKAAAYINGRAGRLASKKYGESILASDVFEFLPKVVNEG
jgi:NAD(P)H-hydrate epimerase